MKLYCHSGQELIVSDPHQDNVECNVAIGIPMLKQREHGIRPQRMTEIQLVVSRFSKKQDLSRA